MYKDYPMKLLNKIIDGQSLKMTEAAYLFDYVWRNDKKGLFHAVLTSAIHTKGETAAELTGFIKATQSWMPRIKTNFPVTDTSGTGGGKIKTLNVSTLAAFVVAAAGHKVLKACFPGVTSQVGSADVLSYFGIDVFRLKAKEIRERLFKVGISPFYSPSISPKLKNRGRLNREFFLEEGIKIRSPYHLVANICSPCKIKRQIYGCYSKDYLEVLANVFRTLSYEHTLTFTSEIGIPEIANVGKTYFFEQKGDKITNYTLSPSQMGVREVNKKDIIAHSKQEIIKDFVKVLKGKASESKIDLVTLNAGAALYLLEELQSIKEGVKKAKDIIYSGKAYEIFNKLVEFDIV